MKKLALMASVAVATVAQAELKIGAVDMLKLVRNHPSYESNKSYLSAKEKDFQKKLEQQRSAVEKIQQEGKEKAEGLRNPMLSATAKTALEKELMDIQQRFLAAQQNLRSEAMRAEQELRDDEQRFMKITTDDLRKRVVALAEKDGYDAILDLGTVPYVKANLTVTDEILKAMGVDPAQAKDGVPELKETNEGK